MIARRARLWWGFGLGAGVVLAALAWASVSVVHLESRNAEIRAQSQRQELIRLALWRADSQLAPLIAMEAARPPGEGSQVLGLSGAESPSRTRSSEVQPQIYQSQNAYATGFFEIDPTGEVAATDDRTLGLARKVKEEPPADAAEHAAGADERQARVEPQTAAAEPQQSYDYEARRQIANLANRDAETQNAPMAKSGESAAPASVPGVSAREYGILSDGLVEPASGTNPAGMALGAVAPPGVGPVEPRWVDTGGDAPELILVRTVQTAAGPKAEGVRLDWPALRSMIESSVSDLLPATTLMPARGADALRLEREGRAYRLATIPALLQPGGAIVPPADRMTPALWALLVTWLATLTTLIAVAGVLRATLRLSDRRARFVGAVTHELRTPLTTFRLYAQMLAGGMVTDDQAKAEYLTTLDRESVRLGEIVENVLEYARLTRRRPGDARPPGERSITASELLARVRPVLSRRAEQSGMDLIVSVDPSVDAGDPPPTVTCDPRSVERILMNLIENACKYALPQTPDDPADGEDADTRIHLDIARTDRHLELLVADHGPGVPRRERERVFGEFHRGPGAAESSRPGLGLGLALSRGLAREMGGDLRMTRRRAHGAEFLLAIPLDAPPTGFTVASA